MSWIKLYLKTFNMLHVFISIFVQMEFAMVLYNK